MSFGRNQVKLEILLIPKLKRFRNQVETRSSTFPEEGQNLWLKVAPKEEPHSENCSREYEGLIRWEENEGDFAESALRVVSDKFSGVDNCFGDEPITDIKSSRNEIWVSS